MTQTLKPASGPGMLTYSGRFVPAALNDDLPSAVDIAVSLSRLTRFTGHTTRWWSVLDHSLFVEQLMSANGYTTRDVLLAGLLHDIGEAITNDISTHFKTHDMRLLQHALDRMLLDRLYPGGYAQFCSWNDVVKEFDQRALLAEAYVIGPGQADKPTMWKYFGAQPRHEDAVLLGEIISIRPPLEKLLSGPQSPTVQNFLELLHELR